MAATIYRVARLLATVMLWLLVLVVGGLLFYRLAGMPETHGELALSGLSGPVRVVRDAHGIPHVFASSRADAFRALGLLHAQDRLWQLEMNRRIVAGRLAEVLGADALETDRFLRMLGVRRNAQRIWDGLDATTREALQAYSEGINAGIAATRGRPWRLSPEFLLLGVRPQPWEPVDSIGWATMMAWDLSGNHGVELLRLALLERLDPERVAQLLDIHPPQPLPDPKPLYASAAPPLPHGAALALAESIARALPDTSLDTLGSNNWVVDASRSATGKPLLANDPHLTLNAPALWYLAHLSAPGLEVIGATLPGLPYVVIGRSDRIAWGFTNTAPDTQDLYLERVDSADPGRYRTPEGWQRFETRTETIRVKGGADVQLEVRETRHGPVISDVLAAARETLAQQGLVTHVLSFAWTMLTPEDRTVRAGLALNGATHWTSFAAALRDFRGPQQNVVYADIDGRVGFVAAGAVPLRRPDNVLAGQLPAPGWDTRFDWIGTIPFDELPRIEQPPDGLIVTANNRIVGDDYPHRIASEWALPYRADRIRRRLQDKPRHDVASFAAIQSDLASPAVAELLLALLRARSVSPLGAQALAMLRDWASEGDGDAPVLSPDRPEPLIAVAWIDRLRREVFVDEVGARLFAQLERHRMRHPALRSALHEARFAHWCDDVGTPERESCDDIVTRALEATMAALASRHGSDPRRWRWGDAHPAVSTHRPFGRHRLLSRMFDLRVPAGGDPSSINAARHDPWDEAEPFANRWAASLRTIFDLSDPDRSQFMISTGQSGHLLSPHYGDLARRWAAAEYLPMVSSRERVEREAAAVLTLTPPR